jgi:hypothetical protein
MAQGNVQFGISLRDFAGVRGNVNFDAGIDDTSTLADLAGQLSSLQTLVDAVTGAKIVEARATLVQAPGGGVKAAAVVGADIEKTLLINFDASGTRYAYGVDIPGVNPAVVPTDRPDPTQAAIAALIAALIAGNYTNAAAQGLVVARDLAVTFRKHRRGLNRVAFVAV